MQKEKMYGKKIRSIRDLRGFSQEYMCEKLKVDISTYSRYETGATKLNIEIIDKIAKVLGVSVADIISETPLIIQTNTSTYGTGGIGNIETYIDNNKEIYEKLIASQKEEILRLSNQIEQLLKMLEKK